MNRGRVSTHVLLYFFMLMLLMVTVGCSSKDDAPPATTYSIAGTVTGAANVVINLTGAATATTTTSGAYSFTGRANGTYTVTPVLAGYTFEPTSAVVVVNGSNMAGVDFVATAGTGHALSGTVTGVGVSGATITLSGDGTGSVTTGTNGTYSFPNLPDGDYTVTPYHSGYAFTPDYLDLTLSGSDSTGNDFASAAANFTQADLEGTWNVQMLNTGGGWMRGTVTVNSAGTLTFVSILDSEGGSAGPTGPIVWEIDETTGEISETDNAIPTDSHYTMTSNKNFIAGTGPGSVGNQLFVIQKVVSGTSYANADVQSKNFVFHQLNVGSSNKWQYGAGSTDGTGAVTLSSQTDPSGTETPGAVGATMSVNGSGIVEMSGMDDSFEGFLSADKKTIVGTITESGGTEYHMMIIQITDGQSSSTSQIAGTSFIHTLATGADDFWSHQSMSITSGGVMTFNPDYVTSGSGSGPSGTETISIGSSGTATLAGSALYQTTFHGQLSYDGKFLVGTQTTDTDVYSLNVITH
ncbi:MAG: hypothetical protein CVU62_01920 [Deltaproteobacteria bacterium HGW-Deltaproteobacteria-2]|jgi:hypothetical protein|nr:MAG: hypothetical protein CVU62_01920 [Deltaproteobacteria bacterium HGW-Deltaproteobacteria-2]